MAAAARLAARARPLARPNPGVGALVVQAGRVIGRGWTRPGGRPHAEAEALAGLARDALAGATLYVTLEPCAHVSARGPACADLVAAARPARVVIGQRDPDPRTAGAGIARLEAAGIAVTVLDDPASARSLAGYLTRQRDGRPWVTLKLAMSLDGRIALADGTSRSPRRVVLTRGPAPAGPYAVAAPQDIAGLGGVLHLYVEGGAGAAAAFLAADLVDELHLYRAPVLIGDGLRAVGALGLAALDAAHGRWQLAERRQLGSDSFEAYLRTRA